MKIVFASYIYSPGYGDPAAWLKRINIYTGILKQLALNHQVVSIEQIDYEGIEIHNNVSFHFKRLSKPGRFLPLRLHRYISSLKPDVVFIHGLHFSLQIVQLRLHLAPEVKILAQHHAEQPHTGIKKRIQQLADKCIDAYLFASVQMGMEWVKRGNLTSPQKIYGVMEVSSVFKPIHKSIAQARTSVNGTPIFLWVGRLNQNKDPLNVVKAFLQFAQINSSARLYMIYQTEELLCDIIELISSSPNAGAIKLIGKIAHHDLLYWFNSADYIISGSHYEGSGAVVCEAMSCGVVPIVTDILSFRMMTKNGQCGFLYQAGNQQQLVTLLQQTENVNLTEKRTAVLNYYTEALSASAIAGKIESILLSL